MMMRRRSQVLETVEQHLSEHPMGETYFCLKAGCSPYTLKNIRKDANVTGETLDKLSAFVKAREKAAVKQAAE